MNTLSPNPNRVTSRDGTSIAYWSIGSGPPLILVVGAFNDHATGAELAQTLSRDFAVITYDRRGRGASGDAPQYSVEREIEDLAAVIAATGGKTAALGFSSGAALILLAAAKGLALTRLVPFDVPWMLPGAGDPPHPSLASDLEVLVAAGKRGEAVELFQRELVGIPEEIIVSLRDAPFRPALEAMAHTLPYEAWIVGDLSVPSDLLAKISQPTLVLVGENSPPWMSATAEYLAEALPAGRREIVASIGHDLTPALAPPVSAFLSQ